MTNVLQFLCHLDDCGGSEQRGIALATTIATTSIIDAVLPTASCFWRQKTSRAGASTASPQRTDFPPLSLSNPVPPAALKTTWAKFVHHLGVQNRSVEGSPSPEA